MQNFENDYSWHDLLSYLPNQTPRKWVKERKEQKKALEDFKESKEVFTNQTDLAKAAITELYENDVAMVAIDSQMQSGKTGVISLLAKHHQTVVGNFIHTTAPKPFYELKNVLIVSALSATDLKTQTEKDLAKYGIGNATVVNGVIGKIRNKVRDAFNAMNVDSNMPILVIVDESHHACREDAKLMKTIRKIATHNNVKLALVSATAFSIAHTMFGKTTLLDKRNFAHIWGETPSTYYGVTRMLEEGAIRFLEDGEDYKDYLDDLCHDIHDGGAGISIVRVPKGESQEALETFDNILNRLEEYAPTDIITEVRIVGSEGLEGVKDKDEVLKAHGVVEFLHGKGNTFRNSVNRRIVLIVTGGFKAGINLDVYKRHLNVMFESSYDNAATVVQGLLGRACGFWSEEDGIYKAGGNAKIYANRKHVTFYSKYVELMENHRHSPDLCKKYEKLVAESEIKKTDVANKNKKVSTGRMVDWKVTRPTLVTERFNNRELHGRVFEQLKKRTTRGGLSSTLETSVTFVADSSVRRGGKDNHFDVVRAIMQNKFGSYATLTEFDPKTSKTVEPIPNKAYFFSTKIKHGGEAILSQETMDMMIEEFALPKGTECFMVMASRGKSFTGEILTEIGNNNGYDPRYSYAA
ncbi:DEAD/DEAH box helicase family protein [Vibrio harveyi]|uniref:hypothetical protein n=1 Tax=Vibrio harveyi TaxID=669 RepID=UPI0018F16A07|nr:hypothetical protein [Vibrio harveyi]